MRASRSRCPRPGNRLESPSQDGRPLPVTRSGPLAWDRLSQTAHALQTAAQALQAGASDALVTAALLHDVGHLLAGLDDAAKDPTLQVPDLARYRPIPESCLKTAG